MDHVAIDLGKRESQICVRTATSEIQLEKRVATIKLKEFLGAQRPSRVILETCSEAFAIADQALSAGHEVRVVPATLVRALGVGQRGLKTDIRDARCLSEASTRVELGSVHIPSELSREMKSCTGMRDALVHSRTLLANTVRGWLRARLIQGVKGGPATLPQNVRTHFAEHKLELPPYLERQLDALAGLTQQIVAADAEIRQLAMDTAECRLLMTVPGVGPVTAVRFFAAIDQTNRFADAHSVESYFGLTPGESSSSDTQHRTGLTKAGSKVVRWLMIQAAWSAWRTRPNDPMVLWAQKIAEKKKRNVAIAALARKMVGIMFALLRDKAAYNASKASKARKPLIEPTFVAEGLDVTEAARVAQTGAPDVLPKRACTKKR